MGNCLSEERECRKCGVPLSCLNREDSCRVCSHPYVYRHEGNCYHEFV